MIQVYKYQDLEIRAKLDEMNNVWFVATDVLAALGIKNSTQALEKVDPDDKKLDYVLHNSGSSKGGWVI
jgi:prophage antirepressor-like protein